MTNKLKLILLILTFATCYTHAEIQFAYYDQYASLYPDCVDDEDSKVYTLDEPFLEEPVFPGGGRVQMTRFVWFSTEVLDVKGPDGEQLKGKVLIKTIIDRCGVAGNIEVIQSLSDQQDAEAVRVIESFPIMKPASLDGYRVKVEMIIPVYFTKTYVPKKKYDFDDDDWGDDWGDDWDDGEYYSDDDDDDDDESEGTGGGFNPNYNWDDWYDDC